MATRYSGSLRIRLRLLGARSPAHRLGPAPDRYRASISEDGRSLWSGEIYPPRAWDHSLDSPEAYDRIARDALAFAAHDDAPTDGADIGEQDYIVTRRPMRATEE